MLGIIGVGMDLLENNPKISLLVLIITTEIEIEEEKVENGIIILTATGIIITAVALIEIEIETIVEEKIGVLIEIRTMAETTLVTVTGCRIENAISRHRVMNGTDQELDLRVEC